MLQLGAPVLIGAGHEELLLLRNFHPPEDGFAWSSRRWCEIDFAFDPAEVESLDEVLLGLDLNAFPRPHHAIGADLFVHLNGLRLGAAAIYGRQTLEFALPASLLTGARNVLAMDTPDAASPAEFGGEDSRLLGLQLFSVGILDAPMAAAGKSQRRRDRSRVRA